MDISSGGWARSQSDIPPSTRSPITHRRSTSIDNAKISNEILGSTPANLGSLLRLFKSDFFDSWIAVSYLFRYRSSGIHDYLCNELYNTKNEEIEFYLSELCRILIYVEFDSRSLERFIMDKCSQSVHIALQAFWLISAEKCVSEATSDQCEDLLAQCYDAVENMKREITLPLTSDKKPSQGIESPTVRRRSTSMKNMHSRITPVFKNDAKARITYFEEIISFVISLGEISDRLLTFPACLRQPGLQEELRIVNENFPVGIYLPLWESSTSYYSICRMVPGESKILKSRERVPYILYFETVTGSEAASSNSLHEIAKASATNLSQYTCNITPRKLLRASQIYESSPFGEPFEVLEERIRQQSPFGKIEKWGLKAVIVKYGDDCRQEFLAMQLITQFKNIFDAANLSLFLKPYHILVTSVNTGIIELIPNSISIHQLKQFYKNGDEKKKVTLLQHFKDFYGEGSAHYNQGIKNFTESLAGYSLVSYLLHLRDRHNANIMIDSEGHLIHIDFGFMLSISPGGINAENAPFKFTAEYLELLGGEQSPMFLYFKELLLSGYLELRKHHEKILILVEMMSIGSKLPCLSGQSTVDSLRERFNLSMTEKLVVEFINNLVITSKDNWRTRGYDKFQYFSNKILY